ncbi:hypothetical protein HJ170_22540 [Vibrio parahaemolyticus]|nr:hypothetical protein [Vibrio parahaemolyticus]HCM0830565.1 hypothetical protein [Vibrio parahaemolyticus]
MKIVCPSCSHSNELEYSEHIKCTECEKSFKGTKFISSSFLGDLLGWGVLIGVGAGGYYIGAEDRYPVSVEYAIVDTCITGSSSRITATQLSKKRSICSCALERTMNDVSYDEYSNDKNVFKKAFLSNVKECQ